MDQPLVRIPSAPLARPTTFAPPLMALARMTGGRPAETPKEALAQALACFAGNYAGLFVVAENAVVLWCEIIGPASPELIAVAALAHMGDTTEGPDGHTVGYWPPRASDLKARIHAESLRRSRLNPSPTWRS